MGQSKIKKERKLKGINIQEDKNRKKIERDNNRLKNTQRVNPSLYNMLQSQFSDKDKEEYSKMGEYMYDNLPEGGIDITPEEQMTESIAYIKEAVRSGLHPDFLEDDEKKIMEDWGGKEWYKSFGYDAENITENTLDDTIIQEKDC